MFFSQRVVAGWNRLPQYVVDAPSTKVPLPSKTDLTGSGRKIWTFKASCFSAHYYTSTSTRPIGLLTTNFHKYFIVFVAKSLIQFINGFL